MSYRRRSQQNRAARNRAARAHNDAFARAFAEAEEATGPPQLLQPADPPPPQPLAAAAGAGVYGPDEFHLLLQARAATALMDEDEEAEQEFEDAIMEVEAEMEAETQQQEDDDDDDVNVDQDHAALLNNIRDSIVGGSTQRSYVLDLKQFLAWTRVERPEWLTPYGAEQLGLLEEPGENEGGRAFRNRTKVAFTSLLRNAFENPLVRMDLITPAGFMGYISSLRNQRTGRMLSKSSYGNKRSALFHLFRLQNKVGFTEEFNMELGNLYRGFNRIRAQDRGNEARQGGAGGRLLREGKEPMSVELYKKLCQWFLNWGTVDGVFAYCYLVLTWNLCCRAKSTSKILFKDMRWTTFDSFEVFFAHTKGDQLGDEAKYSRHCYANPVDVIVSPVFAVSLYLTCCFQTEQMSHDHLFPGTRQYDRFSEILQRCLHEHSVEVAAMGLEDGDIGTHSIRKGAVSYVSSLPGGPPGAAICIRAGWTMGRVKDIYMRYVSAGDEFVGRCLSMLPLLSSKFGASPPHFKDDADEEFYKS